MQLLLLLGLDLFGVNMAFLPCLGCGKPTEYRCADCAIDKREYIPVCENPECRNKHEKENCSRPTKF